MVKGERGENAGGNGLLLSMHGVHKGFASATARIEILKGADLELHRGETLAVVGPSGIGKSTLLHLLGTLDRPDAGELVFEGKKVFAFDDAALARFRNQSIGFVFQFHHLLPEFTALENAMMPALIQGMPRAAAAGAAEAILDRVGLSHRLKHKITEMSGGEQQRVALARALVLQPRLLLADEPTGNLDETNSREVHALLNDLNRDLRMTLVVVTHNMRLAARMSRRITLSEGKLIDADQN
ncbi:MAG: ABC transporter ATP-binding protein [Deltaproteobacteria bacterium]|nr:ABC transporter ATP-binding protein [Deltaproteobacteria bacterium]MBW1954803.1 ABC transporter ATP-binding protein [Deltaproteobacteria bacterium]MBW2042381.1 ABC transporter ATP-binding protein [Deltaproteobacteria bacterium]MBW2133546.1 ABC transporter ATP-binding protein [Deltaproteobacteria bacterium]